MRATSAITRVHLINSSKTSAKQPLIAKMFHPFKEIMVAEANVIIHIYPSLALIAMVMKILKLKHKKTITRLT